MRLCRFDAGAGARHEEPVGYLAPEIEPQAAWAR
jgi:hypothetical protein